MSKSSAPSDVRVVATSVIVSLCDVALSVVVAVFTSSTVMLSQALQGLSDLIAGGILYLGVKRSKREADKRYQFGYGREIFFWVLIAGIFMFTGTGAASVYLGWERITHPEPINHIEVALATLVFGLVTNFFAFSLSLKRLRRADHHNTWWRQLLHSSIVETKATLLIDFLGTAAAVLGLVALGLFLATGNVSFDGFGSIAIGLVMMVTAVLLILDVRDLIVGRSVDGTIAREIRRATVSVNGIQAVLDLRTMYLGSAKLLVIVEVHVADDLNTDQIEDVIDNVKEVVKRRIPQVHHIQVEVETPDDEEI
jgi:cation diffusion facilitator family transporter